MLILAVSCCWVGWRHLPAKHTEQWWGVGGRAVDMEHHAAYDITISPDQRTTEERDPMSSTPLPHFQRFTAEDHDHVQRHIPAAHQALAHAITNNDEGAMLDAASSLGALLTTARNEAAARAVLLPYLEVARRRTTLEAAGWLLLSLATANQYLNLREEANTHFAEALDRARQQGWRELEHYVLHHWGRSLVEEGALARAKACFSAALTLREAMHEPRQASTRCALAALAALETTAESEPEAAP